MFQRRFLGRCRFLALAMAFGFATLLCSTALARKPKRQVVVESTAWDVEGTSKGSIKKVGKLGGDLRLQLFLGPLSLMDDQNVVVETLDAGDFLINDVNSGVILRGTYVDQGKGKLTLFPDPDELREILASTFESAFDFINLDITALDLTRVSLTAKLKASGDVDTIKLKLKSKFTATGTASGNSGSAKGGFSFSTSGAGVPLVN